MLRMFAEGIDGFKGGLSAKKYMTITGAPTATATRDLTDMVAKGALVRQGGTQIHPVLPEAGLSANSARMPEALERAAMAKPERSRHAYRFHVLEFSNTSGSNGCAILRSCSFRYASEPPCPYSGRLFLCPISAQRSP